MVHDSGKAWSLLGGWKPRQVLPGDLVHPSVLAKIARTAGTASAYRPRATGYPP